MKTVSTKQNNFFANCSTLWTMKTLPIAQLKAIREKCLLYQCRKSNFLKVSAYQPHLCTNKTVVTLVWLQQRSMQRFWLQLKKKSEIVRTNWKPIQSVNDNGVNIYFPNNSTNQTVLKRCNLCQFTTITIHTNHPLQFCSK